MARLSTISMIWDGLVAENPTLGADLDGLIIQNEPGRCFGIKRQRNRGEGPVKNPRKWVIYRGRRVQVGTHRLIRLRAQGRIDAGHYVGHPRPKEHGACGNPERLRSYLPSAHRVKPKAEHPKRKPNHRERKLSQRM